MGRPSAHYQEYTYAHVGHDGPLQIRVTRECFTVTVTVNGAEYAKMEGARIGVAKDQFKMIARNLREVGALPAWVDNFKPTAV